MIPFLVRLLLYLLVGFVALKSSVIQPLIELFCLQLAIVAASVLNIFDAAILRDDAIIYRNTYGYAIEITKECSALEFLVTLCAAILAFSASRYQHLKAVFISILLVTGINLIRLMSLIYFKVGFSLHNFLIVHEQIWPFLIALLVGGFFLHWCLSLNTQQAIKA